MDSTPVQLKSNVQLASAQAGAIAPVLFELITKDLGTAITITDPEGRVVWVNRSFEQLSGYTLQELHGQKPGALLQGEQTDPATRDLMASCLANRQGFVVEVVNRRKNGQPYWIKLGVRALINADSSLAGFIATQYEITERKRAQADRDATMRLLEAQNAELTDFAYSVSHDLRSPLVTIRGFSGLARRSIQAGLTTAALEHLDRIDRASGRMVELLNDLLDLTRIGRVVAAADSAPLTELAEDVISSLHAEIERAGALITVQPNLPTVFGDLSRIKQVLANLLTNAIKFTDQGVAPRIELGGRVDGSQIEFFVQDHGRGIAPEYQPKLFGLFQRLHADVEGTGIGLALVKRIVELHQGNVTVQSAGEGQGARFVVRLPGNAASLTSPIAG
jgi:PAS domain S-box-containing protein